MTQYQGQALVEVLTITTFIIAALFVVLRDFATAHEDTLVKVNAARQVLWQPVYQPGAGSTAAARVTMSDDYAFAEVSRSSLGALARLTDLHLATNNLLSIQVLEHARPMAVLLDDWSITSVNGLVTQPRQLVSSRVLHDESIRTLQDILGWLPNAREFSSASLQFGHINPDAVPLISLCESSSC